LWWKPKVTTYAYPTKSLSKPKKAFAAIGGNIEWRMETEVQQFVQDL
jgi:hypothetical protein